ncbi:MAG: sigma-70 family RNA polymerase sigma factor [Candidatus Thermofonsia bacterium]|nr:MAG: sigma-70 family RNA polymerase sigma factor [Candidatus Thermofonsia bacterium]
MTAEEEQALIRRAQAGDTAAFGELVRQQQTAVFNTAYRLLGTRRDAEDATQEAFLRAYRALARFDPERPFAPWIKTIVTNLCYNQLARKQEQLTRPIADLRGQDDSLSLDDWQSHTPQPEQLLAQSEREARTRAAILALPPHYRAVIELRHFQGLDYQAIAQVMNRSVANVKSDLFRARKKLAEMLKEDIDKPSSE